MKTSARHQYFGVCHLVLTLSCALAGLQAADWPQWRGPNRDGISQEKGLLKDWPQEGPKLLWKLNDIGTGYSTPSVVGDRLFLMANEGLENEFVGAYAVQDGKKIWTTRLGLVGNPKMQPNFPAARSTPTVDGNFIYALSSDGDLACLEKDSGKVRWQKSLRKDFGGKPGGWAYSESPLIDGNTLVCCPGGTEATILALNKSTGEVLWKCALPEGDDPAYGSAVVVEVGGIRQYVKLLQKGLVGVDAKTGKFLWRYAKTISRYNANIPTPLAANDIIYVASAGTGGGAIKLKASNGKIEVAPLYFELKLPTAIGGAVKVGDFLYATTGNAMLCLDFATGKVKWENPALGAASLCYADERLYLHGENGAVALVEPSPEAYREKGRFTPPEPPARKGDMEKAWAYPVVANGQFFIRDHNCLWCYDVNAK